MRADCSFPFLSFIFNSYPPSYKNVMRQYLVPSPVEKCRGHSSFANKMGNIKYNSPIEFALSIDLEKNIADEAEAREGYYRLLQDYQKFFSKEELDEIEEIIAEELKHTIILENILYRINGIIPEK